MSYNSYGQNSRNADPQHQIWVEVYGVKHGGGSIDLSSMPVGTVIPAGTPIYLDKSGGTLKPIYFYEVLEAVTATDTEVIIKGVKKPAATGFMLAVPSAIGGTGTGVAYSAVSDVSDFVYKLTIIANAFGEMEAGTVIGVTNAAGASKKLTETAVPNGLLWHDIVSDAGDTWATGAVVDMGRIFEDRIVGGVPAAYKAAMPSIKFEKGI